MTKADLAYIYSHKKIEELKQYCKTQNIEFVKEFGIPLQIEPVDVALRRLEETKSNDLVWDPIRA